MVGGIQVKKRENKSHNASSVQRAFCPVWSAREMTLEKVPGSPSIALNPSSREAVCWLLLDQLDGQREGEEVQAGSQVSVTGASLSQAETWSVRGISFLLWPGL